MVKFPLVMFIELTMAALVSASDRAYQVTFSPADIQERSGFFNG